VSGFFQDALWVCPILSPLPTSATAAQKILLMRAILRRFSLSFFASAFRYKYEARVLYFGLWQSVIGMAAFEMTGERNTRIGPVCRFGPGGDFVSFWPRKLLPFYTVPKKRLLRVFSAVSGMLGELFDTELVAAELPAAQNQTRVAAQGSAYQRRAEPFLFPDVRLANSAVRRTQSHIARPHRRTLKKKPALAAPEQPTLFDADPQHAKTA